MVRYIKYFDITNNQKSCIVKYYIEKIITETEFRIIRKGYSICSIFQAIPLYKIKGMPVTQLKYQSFKYGSDETNSVVAISVLVVISESFGVVSTMCTCNP